MSVFTKVTADEVSAWLEHYDIGSLVELQGIAAGVENTNYFVTTSRGAYVLTLFERLAAGELPFYIELMAHLARRGLPCPAPIAARGGNFLGELRGKPAALVTRLPGVPVMQPQRRHCARVGEVLAHMHLAVAGYPGRQENPRGPRWWHDAAPEVTPFLDPARRDLLQSELEFQSQCHFPSLPRGAVHADLFRDNVLFEGDAIGGVIDFYFAGVDTLVFDVAVTLNDWCVQPDGEVDPERSAAFLKAYRAVRGFTAEERDAWPAALRAAALRFWLSRLYDFYLPRAGEMTHAHDPEHFRRVLESRRARRVPLD